jgi:toxin-antitoxin system PIN domain toxin
MKVVDANVLVYAVNEDAVHHQQAREWLDRSLAGASGVGFSWLVMMAFLRLTTHPSIFGNPLTAAAAVAQLEAWMAQPAAHILEPTSRHLLLMAELLSEVGRGGNLVNDAHLAALAVEHRATIVSFDNDFDRFGVVRWEHPGR